MTDAPRRRLSDPQASDAGTTLTGFRWVLAVASLSVPLFWLVYRVVDPTAFDPLEFRLAYSGLAILTLAATFASQAVRRWVWIAALCLCGILVAYFTWLGVLNGLNNAWIVGVLTAGSASTLALAPYARSVRGVWGAAATFWGVMVGTLVATQAPFAGALLLGGYFSVLSALIGIGATLQVHTRLALQTHRDELAARGRLLRTVIDAIPEHIYVKDRDGRCLVRNQFSADALGLESAEEAVGLTVFDTSGDSEIAAAYWASEDHVMQSGESELEVEEPYVFNDAAGWIVSSRIPLRGDDGSVIGLVGISRDVTARKRSEARLRHSEARMRSVLDAAPNAFITLDASDCVLDANPAVELILGYAPEEMVGRGLADLIVPERFRDEHRAKLVRYVETGETGSMMERLSLPLVRADGDEIVAELTFRPLDTADDCTLFTLHIRDLRAQQAAEARLVQAKEAAEAREAEVAAQRRLLQTVIDTIPDHIYVKDTNGRATLRNVASAQSLGYEDPADAVGLSDTDADCESGAAHLGDDLQVIRTGEPIVDKEEQGAGGVWLLTTKIPLRDETGTIVGLVGVSRDVTAQQAAQEALREAKEAAEATRRLLRTVIDAIPDCITVKDTEGRCVTRNLADARVMGYETVEESLGMTLLESSAPRELAEYYHAEDIRVMELGEPMVAVEGERAFGDGWKETTKVPLHSESGVVIGLVSVMRDITERKEAEREIVRAKEAAEAAREAAEDATRAKSEFLANMSHEIRTPMNGVIGMTSLLMDTPLDQEQRDFVETIRTSGDALLTIINDILDFSKIEAGMLSLEVHPFEIRKAVEEALDLVAQMAAEKGVELAYLIEDGVPRTVKSDITRVRQVLVNLLSNAVKFTPSGSVCVRVNATPPDAVAGTMSQIQFSVEDTGIGIAPDKLGLVFESFSQADASTTRKFGGTGLGLTICRRLTDMMGGDMEVESELGSGSTFRFSIQAEVAASERRVFLRSEQPALEGRRVLIVDDNDINREILSKLSSRWRMVWDEARSGTEALDAARRAHAEGRPYDLILLDMQMPEMDGLDVARALTGPDGPVIVMLTSISREGGLRQMAREAGVHRLLYKPTKPSQLYDALIEAFDGRPAAEPIPEPADPRPTAWIARPAPTTLDKAEIRILLAEDNVVNQKVALRLLARLGHDADMVADGAEALASVEARSAAGGAYDVVFMDVQMPEMDGLEATRRIRASASIVDQPWIVSLTANAMEGDRDACLEAGADDYLPKPVHLSTMREALERAVHSRAGQERSRERESV